jgi:hypothetical protein
VQSKSDGKPPDLKGFLSKWVNYKSGWRTRWFVLENGALSYCRFIALSLCLRSSRQTVTGRMSKSPAGVPFRWRSRRCIRLVMDPDSRFSLKRTRRRQR